MATKDMMGKAWLMLCAAYPNAKVTDETAKLYARMLSRVSDEHLQVAVMRHIEKSKWFPTVAELKHLCEAAPYRIATQRDMLKKRAEYALLGDGGEQ